MNHASQQKLIVQLQFTMFTKKRKQQSVISKTGGKILINQEQ